MHLTSVWVLIAGAVAVAVLHSILPDHWVPLAVVARTQRWSLMQVARISGLAASGHVVASLVLAAIVALIGLRFQSQIESQQGHLIGGLLILSGAGFLIWGLTGRGHPHGHLHGPGGQGDHDHDHGEAGHDHDDNSAGGAESHDHDPHEHEVHEHAHEAALARAAAAPHAHEHAHAELVHSHEHDHEAFIRLRQRALVERSRQRSMSGLLATVAVPFGVAASPDLTVLPIALAAGAYGGSAVVAVFLAFAVVTIAVFVGLTVGAAAAGYQVKGEWLEDHATTVTAIVLIAIGVVAFVGL